jgi:hypothetical protein
MIGTKTNPSSLADFLLGRGGRGALAARLGGLDFPDLTGVLARLTPAARELVGNEVADVATSLLDLDLGQVAITAWRTVSDLRHAARATLDAPGTRQVVDLTTHRITSVHEPYLEVLVNGVVVARVQFVLRLELTIAILAVVVNAGRITSVQSGQSDLAATLAVAGVEVLSRKAKINLAVTVRLGEDGVPILAEHERGTLYASGPFPIVPPPDVR